MASPKDEDEPLITKHKPPTPHPSQASTYNQSCAQERINSLKCIEKYYDLPDKGVVCKQLFDVYKECRREEHEERKRERERVNNPNKFF